MSTSSVDLLFSDEGGDFARDIDGRLVRLDPVTADDFARDVVLKIDGQDVTVKKAVAARDAEGNFLKDDKDRVVPRATTVYDAAAQLYAGLGRANPIPVLCHRDHLKPVAVCRLCVVEISKVKRGQRQTERKFLPACQHRVEDTMEIQTVESPNDPKAGERVRAAVAMLTELLMCDHPAPCPKQRETGDCELEGLAARFGVGPGRLPARPGTRGRDDSSVVIAVDHDSCILCDRCVRGCNDVRDNQVIGRAGKGFEARIAFDLDDPMGGSSCVACGECMVSCPTGALTHRGVVKADWSGIKPAPEPVSVDVLVGHPNPNIRRAFEAVSRPFLQYNSQAVVRRQFRKGEVICREGTPGASAFFIERGSVEVYLQSSRSHVVDQAGRGLFGLVRKFTSRLRSRAEDRRDGERGHATIPIDAPVALPYGKPTATMTAGDLFGEMTCMNSYPRSATVRAAEDCTVLEMLRNVLYIMQRSPAFRKDLEETYRDRAINNHLHNVALFAPLRADEARFEQLVAELRRKVTLRRCDPGEVILRQGAPADDGFYLVRIGFVKVSQRRPGGEHVLNYLGPGSYFGEIGLLSSIPQIRERSAPGVRSATCTALDHVDLIRIGSEEFRAIIDRFPDLRTLLVEKALKTLERDADLMQGARSDSLDEFLTQGLAHAESLLVLDLEKCTRCDECTKACADTHDGITRLIREGMRYDKFLVASSCRSCLDPYCLVGCPVSAIRRRDTQEIFIEDWCIGCGNCAQNCPYGNINMHPFPTGETAPDPLAPERRLPVVQQKATTCDLCHSLGPHSEPSCVYACPHDAAHRMKGSELRRLVEQAMDF